MKKKIMAAPGFEPGPLRLGATCSTTELLRLSYEYGNFLLKYIQD
jgi:hypothetical protein